MVVMATSVIWQEYPPEKLLHERFHIATDFHPGQREIIEQLVQGQRILAIQRTGWGKSLLYQIASLYFPSLTIIFSPLKALMRDQCERCNTIYAIPSAILSSDFTTQENHETLARAVAGEFKLLFITPERLGSVSWQRIVPTLHISMIVIDEAHLDFSAHTIVQQQKLQELQDMQQYAQTASCYMRSVTTYIGDTDVQNCGVCGTCRPENFPLVRPIERIQASVTHFLESEYLPIIETCIHNDVCIHEAGWALSYHGTNSIGKLVALSKYENGGPFALSIVQRAVDVIRVRYPLHTLQAIVSVPSTTQGNTLVRLFAQQVAARLNLPYLPVLQKTRHTRKQKSLTNRAQKEENVKGAFYVQPTANIFGCALLLIDDIFDSGYTVRESSHILIQAGARIVYPFTITRTYHSDNL